MSGGRQQSGVRWGTLLVVVAQQGDLVGIQGMEGGGGVEAVVMCVLRVPRGEGKGRGMEDGGKWVRVFWGVCFKVDDCAHREVYQFGEVPWGTTSCFSCSNGGFCG